ncbi:hypothetical protein JR316_0003784 [Psilocybe cubensis]|uniref:Uncharacterized protein n=1 Tax=Psilocybe cubensis TaxID=181762 RepID=A0ACB8H927_PSICU|nr:hypothetical protein JR316_0003784 [Psilocybe cubensis]KAH9484303.1 hypothetical protein JR316_0003784 [Psilocybe cubensis]
MASTDSAQPPGPPLEVEAPPPADHVIRPHHIGLLTVLMVAFRNSSIKDFPSPFALHLLRVLLNEISEVAQHKSHAELMSIISTGSEGHPAVFYDFQMAIATITFVAFSRTRKTRSNHVPCLDSFAADALCLSENSPSLHLTGFVEIIRHGVPETQPLDMKTLKNQI